MQNKNKKIYHSGKLYWPSLANLLPENLFAPSKKTVDDPYSFGWELANFEVNHHIYFKRMLYATAESVVALSIIAENMRKVGFNEKFKLIFDDDSSTWSKALLLDQAASGNWLNVKPEWKRPHDCYAYPLRRINIEDKDNIYHEAHDLSQTVALLQNTLSIDNIDIVQNVLKYIAFEVLCNIFEHAYIPSENRYFYTCGTVTPAKYFEDMSFPKQQYMAAQEIDWLRENSGSMILEIAIGDAGQGIPKTLWNDAKQKNRPFASKWNDESMSNMDRAIAHQKLCEYSFHHDSTRKKIKDFDNPASMLSWRGLHRCLKQTEHLSGSITLCSGRGRSGYAFIKNRITPIVLPKNISTDFPGTLVVLRFPTVQKQKPSKIVSSKDNPEQLRVGYLASELEIEKGIPNEEVTQVFSATDDEIKIALYPEQDTIRIKKMKSILPSYDVADSLERFSKSGKKAIMVYSPFRNFENEGEFISIIKKLPPNHVSVFLFSHIPENISIQLRAYAISDWAPTTHGTPRLICLWNQERPELQWKIVGELPVKANEEDIYKKIEEVGFVCLAQDPSKLHEVAIDLARNYPDFLSWNNDTKTLSLLTRDPIIEQEDLRIIIDRAFKLFFQAVKPGSVVNAQPNTFLFECKNGEAIRLPTGRLVKRFLSIFSMLRNLPILASALSQRLMSVLKQIAELSEICLIADSTASYIVLNRLLGQNSEIRSIRVFQPGIEGPLEGKVILFVDIIYKGDTVKRLVRGLKNLAPSGGIIVACLDSRRAPLNYLDDCEWKIYSLIKYHFDPNELLSEVGCQRIHDLDTITNIPMNRQCEFIDLATNSERGEFLKKHNEIFISGFHRVGDKVHTVSLDTNKIIKENENYIIKWLSDETLKCWDHLQKKFQIHTIVIFCDPNMSVYKMIQQFAYELARRIPGKNRILISSLTGVAPIAKPVFPRGEENLLAEVKEASRQERLFPLKSIKDFIAIYVSDACLTGRSLQDFLTKCTALKNPGPKAIFGLMIVNRLSPREVRFLDICKLLSCNQNSIDNDGPRQIPFYLTSLFRLQVKSAEYIEPQSVLDIISGIDQHSAYFDDRLKNYIKHIRQRLHTIFFPLHDTEYQESIVCHPFSTSDFNYVSVTTDAILLRHILSLNEQNEGVFSPIYKNISESLEKEDYSTLSIFALEPQLLHKDPLAVWCWPNIKKLCMLCLKKQSQPQLKSDALTILFQRPDEFRNELNDILNSVHEDSELITQLSSFLLSLLLSYPEWRNAINATLDGFDTQNDDNIGWLRKILNTPYNIQTNYSIKNENEAILRIYSLIVETWPHAKGLNKWQELDDIIKKLTKDRVNLSSEEIDLGLSCMIYAENVLLSGLAGIHFITTKRRLQEAERAWNALIDSFRTVGEIRYLLGTMAKGKIDQKQECIDNLIDLWNHLRNFTLKAASAWRILGSNKKISEKPSIIEEILPSIYCAPYSIIRELTSKNIDNFNLKADKKYFIESVVIVSCPVPLIYEVLSILIGNMKDHAVLTSCSCELNLINEGVNNSLRIIFFNKIDLSKPHGAGNGIPLLKRYAKDGEFKFNINIKDDKYISELIFKKVLLCIPSTN